MSNSKMKLNDVYATAKRQDKRQLCRFMRDMKRAGLKQRFFHGGSSWSGPAVVCENLDEVLSETDVPCQSVQKGLRYLVHPKQGL
ncbi:MAG TPA: hypothetical protein VK137_18645 [Planctomycetaceae bacterium]|nr:hypothetical protein [Planctomycetaceae bacterium]